MLKKTLAWFSGRIILGPSLLLIKDWRARPAAARTGPGCFLVGKSRGWNVENWATAPTKGERPSWALVAKRRPIRKGDRNEVHDHDVRGSGCHALDSDA